MYTMKCYKEKQNHDTGKWMALEIIILSKVSQTDKYHVSLHEPVCKCVCVLHRL